MAVWVGVAVGGCSGVKVCDGKGRSVPVNCGRGVDVVDKLVLQPARIPARSRKSVNFTFGMLPIIPSREAQLFLLILVMNEMPKIIFFMVPYGQAMQLRKLQRTSAALVLSWSPDHERHLTFRSQKN